MLKISSIVLKTEAPKTQITEKSLKWKSENMAAFVAILKEIIFFFVILTQIQK